MVASDVYDYYINNKLNKAIDEYWQSKYPTFAKGRIKRMRKGESFCNGILRRIHGTSIVIPRNNPDMYEIMMLTQDTRWNRH